MDALEELKMEARICAALLGDRTGNAFDFEKIESQMNRAIEDMSAIFERDKNPRVDTRN